MRLCLTPKTLREHQLEQLRVHMTCLRMRQKARITGLLVMMALHSCSALRGSSRSNKSSS